MLIKPYSLTRSQSPSLRDGYNHAYNIDTNIFVFEKLYDTLVCTAAWHLEIDPPPRSCAFDIAARSVPFSYDPFRYEARRESSSR